MLEEEDGTSESQQRPVPSPAYINGARSASPAKRSAADMEDESRSAARAPGSFTLEQDTGPTDFDAAMSGMTPSGPAVGESQTRDTTAASMATSSYGSVDTSATSVQSELDPTDATQQPTHKEPYSPERMAQQVAHVQLLASKPLDEGVRGVAISTRWLARVLSRTPDGAKSSEYPKEAREGLVGPLDNSDILAPGALDPPLLKDREDAFHIPLKPGLRSGDEYEMMPWDAYGFIIGEYGVTQKHPPIRYAHDTAEQGASQSNMMYEVYPPLITIRKMPQPKGDEEVNKTRFSAQALRLKKDREGRGQVLEDDAAILVASRTERVKKFLTRAKEAAGIPIQTKIKVWRVLDASDVAVDQPDNVKTGVPSPPASRATSPVKSSSPKLVVDAATFGKLEVGRDIDELDVKDETNNEKYNGRSDIGTVGLFQDCTIILEEQKGGPAGGEFASDANKITNRSLKTSTASKAGSGPGSGRTSPAPGTLVARGRPTRRRDGRTRGCTGLTNLGNTCYMNSALQCIRSVEELACYFLDGKYKREINNDNPLGHHGAMANSYAGVLKGIYDSATNVFGPQEFKRTLGRLQPMFSGYGQQDSQEFLSFLVDALHEDLNRIKKKPYLENPDSDDSKVKDHEYTRELGEVYRTNHQKRNDSIAMDLFSGFYKNTMECPVCDKVSVTFDPYSLLTVQLPMDHAFQHSVCFVPLQGKPVIHEIDMDKMSTTKALKEYVASKHAGVDATKMWMAEVWNHKLYKVFDDNMTLAEAGIEQKDNIFLYQLEDVPKNAPSGKRSYSGYGPMKSEDSIPAEGMDSEMADSFAVPVLSRSSGKYSSSHDMALFPLYITLTREEAKSHEIILKKILIAVANITSRPILKEFAEEMASTPAKESEEAPSTATDDAAGVSDHSAQSEEDYVKVSLEKPAALLSSRASPMQIDEAESSVPDGFMDSQYFLSPALRNQLFDVQYMASSDNGLHSTNTSIGNRWGGDSMSPLFDRVKPPRRSSVQSSASEHSTSTSGSVEQGNEQSEESDADADDAEKPDIVLGESQSTADTAEESDDELNGPTTYSNSRSGRRKIKRGKGKNRRFDHKRNSMIKYGKKNNSSYGQSRTNTGVSLGRQQQEDSPYYIQLGEAIILDWRSEAFDSLFGGGDDANEMRGHLIVSDDGRTGPVFEDEELQARRARRAARKKHGATLEDCFAETGKKEKLSEDNAWYCNRCKELRQAYKQLEIWTLPDILVVHMKRFGGGRAMRDKIDILVDYPIEALDMGDKVGLREDDKEYVYDLFAVDCHFGGLGGGHYTAMAKNFFDGNWYNYNDSSCSAVTTPGALKTSAAYLLFYRRRSEKPLGPPELQKIVTDYRNPQSANGDDAEESETGEGRLGGPVLSSQHGSSSALAEAGVVGTSSLDANGGVGADSPLTTKQTMMTNIADATTSGWGWEAIDTNDDQNDGDSNKAEYDSGIGDDRADDDMSFRSIGSTGVNNSPAGETMEFEATWSGPSDDPPAVDVHPPYDDAVGDMD